MKCERWLDADSGSLSHTHTESKNTSDFRLVCETVGGGMGGHLAVHGGIENEHTHNYRRPAPVFEHTQQERIISTFNEKNTPTHHHHHLISPLRLFVCVLDVHWCCSLISESNFLSHGRDGFGRCATFD